MAKKQYVKRTDGTVVKKQTTNLKTGKSETRVKVVYPDGTSKDLLNPAQKGLKYATELKQGADVYDGVILTGAEKAYRSGYLKARSDNAKAYNANKSKKAAVKAAKKAKKSGGK